MIARRGVLARGAAGMVAGATLAASVAPARSGPIRFGLALGSGSVHGIAHIGVLRALERLGARVDVIAGTSAGAIAGALFAAGLSADEVTRQARRFEWQGAGISWLAPLLSPRSNEPLQRLVEEVTGAKSIGALRTRFAAVATDLVDGRRVLLEAGPLGPAVGASSAIPVMYAPVRIGGRDLVDGALTEPVPVRAARQIGADFVLAVDVAYRPDEEPATGVPGIAFQTMHIMVNALIDAQIGEADFALRMNLHHVMRDRSDFFDRLVEAGELAVMRAWPALRGRLAGAAPSSRPAARSP